MPRPKRDYGASIRADLQKLDDQIRALVVRRGKLLRMLTDYESTTESDIDVAGVLQEIVGLGRRPDPKRRSR